MRRAHFAKASLLTALALCAESTATQPLTGAMTEEGAWVVYAASTHVGTHQVSAGGTALASLDLSQKRSVDISLLAGTGARYTLRGFGIPGDRLEGDARAGLELSFGEERWSHDVYRGAETRRANAVSYLLLGYASTDGTSQYSGALTYNGVRSDGGVLSVVFENDFLALQRFDRFRTFALRTRFSRPRADGIMAGIGATLLMWTGTTEGLGYLNRGERYDLSGQYGGAYSHGILAVDLYRGPLRLSLGYDAEQIRTIVQNSFHYLIDDGAIPALDRGGRVYLQLSLNDVGPLY